MKKLLTPNLSKGIQHMLLSTVCFSLMNVFIKQVSHIPTMEVVFFRCFVSLVLCMAVIKRLQLNWKGSNRKLLLARGFFGTLALYTFFTTIQNIPLGTAVTIQYLSPVFTTIIAIFLLNEHVKPWQWAFFAVSFVGVVFIKGFDDRISTQMLAIGVVSAVSSGFAYNMVRSLKEKEHPVVVVLHFQIIGTLAGFVFMLFNWKTPQGTDWFYLLAIGLLTQLGQMNLTRALQLEKIASVSILNYLGVIYALVFGYLFFGEHYGAEAYTGIMLVLAGVVLNYFYTRSKATPVIEELTNVEE